MNTRLDTLTAYCVLAAYGIGFVLMVIFVMPLLVVRLIVEREKNGQCF